MTAPFLRSLFDSAYVIALTAWVGGVLFFSFAVAPILFRVLGDEAGGRFARALLPRYYLWGAIAGAVALPAFLGVPLSFPEYRRPMVGVEAMAIVAGVLIQLYGANALVPALVAAREEGATGRARFERLHRRSVGLNLLAMALGLGLLVAFATRPAPRTSGIVEMTPTERARYDARIEAMMRAIEAGRRPVPEADGTERFPIDAATLRELNDLYEQRRKREAERKRR